jgi:hypothetical protein
MKKKTVSAFVIGERGRCVIKMRTLSMTGADKLLCHAYIKHLIKE